jgi:hypothetical protein
MCPESIFANRRTDKETTVMKYEIISIATIRGTSASGVPGGRKNPIESVHDVIP